MPLSWADHAGVAGWPDASTQVLIREAGASESGKEDEGTSSQRGGMGRHHLLALEMDAGSRQEGTVLQPVQTSDLRQGRS